MRTIENPESLNEPADFTTRVQFADYLLDRLQAISRILREENNDANESKLASEMVNLRNEIVKIREQIGFEDRGPMILIDDQWSEAFREFTDGAIAATETYLAIQAGRFDALSWITIYESLDQLTGAIRSFNGFLAIVHAHSKQTSLEAAKRTIQLHRDSRRSKISIAIGNEPSESQLNIVRISAIELTEVFKLGEKSVRKILNKAGCPKTDGRGQTGNRYTKSTAIEILELAGVKRLDNSG